MIETNKILDLHQCAKI